MNSQLDQVRVGRGLLIFFMVASCLVLSFFSNPFLVWGGFIILVTGIIFLGHPKQLLFMYWFWMTVVASILQMYTPKSVLGIIPETIFAVVGGTAVLALAMRRSVDASYFGILKMYGVLLGVIAFSLLFNGSGVKNVAMSFTEYYGFLLVFLATAIFVQPTEKLLRFMVKVAMIHLFLCVILNILGFLGLNPLVAHRVIFDKAIGTFPTQGSMGFYSLALLFLSLGMIVHLNAGRQRMLWMIAATVSFFSFFITFNFHAYVYLLVMYLMFTFLYPKGRMLKVGLGLLVVVFLMLSLIIAPTVMGVDKSEFRYDIMGQITDTRYVRDRIEMLQDSPKMEVFQKMLIYNFNDSPLEWWVGNGPGMGMGTVGVKFRTPTALEYLLPYYATASGVSARGSRTALQTPHNGLYAIWSDIGAIGFVAYVSIYIYAAVHLLQNIRRHRYTNAYQLVLAESCVLWMALLVGTNFMSDTFYRHELLGGLWIFTALVWKPLPSSEKDLNKRNVYG